MHSSYLDVVAASYSIVRELTGNAAPRPTRTLEGGFVLDATRTMAASEDED